METHGELMMGDETDQRWRNWTRLARLCAGAALFGCSVETLETGNAPQTKLQPVLAEECEELGATINGHTCQHGQYGPFGSVTASSNPTFSGSTPKFSGIHRYFTVDLPGSGGSYQGTVKYTPSANDSHVVYFDPSVTVTVKDRNQNPVSPELVGTTTGCAYLTGYAVFDLKKSTSTHAPYWITFSASTSEINAALEEVSPMAETWYVDQDGDGFGRWPYAGPSEYLTTACVPWGAFENGATQFADCDDGDAGVYPGSGCP